MPSSGLIDTIPVVLIAAIYNGCLAVLSAATALVSADYFLQDPLYSLVNDNPREYDDLSFLPFWLVTAIKFIRVLMRIQTSLPKSRST
jgi:hypothetical protein